MTRPKPGPYGPWPVRGHGKDGNPVTGWVFLRDHENGDPVPWFRIDNSSAEIELGYDGSAQLITSIRDAWDAVREIERERER